MIRKVAGGSAALSLTAPRPAILHERPTRDCNKPSSAAQSVPRTSMLHRQERPASREHRRLPATGYRPHGTGGVGRLTEVAAHQRVTEDYTQHASAALTGSSQC